MPETPTMRLETNTLVWAALAGLLLCALPGPAAWAADCRLPGVQASVRLNESFGDIRYSNGYSGQQLAAKRRRAGPSPVLAGVFLTDEGVASPVRALLYFSPMSSSRSSIFSI